MTIILIRDDGFSNSFTDADVNKLIEFIRKDLNFVLTWQKVDDIHLLG